MTTGALSRDEGSAKWAEPDAALLPAAVSAPVWAIRERNGISFFGAATLALIGIVVVLVSLPRLRRFALRENEIDALRMLRVLSEDSLAHEEVLASGDLGALLAASTAGRVRLEDVEVLGDGRLRRHGYVFAAVRQGDGRRVLLAWPWQHGRTGLGAFSVEPGGRVSGLANENGRFSGPDRPPSVPGSSERGGMAPWRPIPGF